MLWLVFARGWRMSHVTDDFMGGGMPLTGHQFSDLNCW